MKLVCSLLLLIAQAAATVLNDLTIKAYNDLYPRCFDKSAV